MTARPAAALAPTPSRQREGRSASFAEPPWSGTLPSAEASAGPADPDDSGDTVMEGLEDDPFDARLAATAVGLDEPTPYPRLGGRIETLAEHAFARRVHRVVVRSGEAAESIASDGVEHAERALDHLASHRTARPLYVVGAVVGVRAFVIPLFAAVMLTAWIVGGDDGAPGKSFPKGAAAIADVATAAGAPRAGTLAVALPAAARSAGATAAAESAIADPTPSTARGTQAAAPSAETEPAAETDPAPSGEPEISAAERRRAAARRRRILRRRAARRRARRARTGRSRLARRIR